MGWVTRMLGAGPGREARFMSWVLIFAPIILQASGSFGIV